MLELLHDKLTLSAAPPDNPVQFRSSSSWFAIINWKSAVQCSKSLTTLRWSTLLEDMDRLNATLPSEHDSGLVFAGSLFMIPSSPVHVGARTIASASAVILLASFSLSTYAATAIMYLRRSKCWRSIRWPRLERRARFCSSLADLSMMNSESASIKLLIWRK